MSQEASINTVNKAVANSKARQRRARCIHSQAYGWPFYIARKALRAAGRACQGAADALSLRERYGPASWIAPVLPENAGLRGLHDGKRCFVVMNGPSLRQVPIEALAGEVTFAANGFWRHPAAAMMDPTHYLLVDEVFFDGSPNCDAFLASLRTKALRTTFFAPLAMADRIESRRLLPAAQTRYVAMGGVLRSAKLRRIDMTRPLPGVINVAQLAIMCALHMGCREIFLLGMDHDWLSHRGEESHFYSGKTIENHKVAHGEMSGWSYGLLLRDVAELWQGYERLKAFAEKRGVRIANCTDGGFLDVFERARLEDVPGLDAISRAARANRPIAA